MRAHLFRPVTDEKGNLLYGAVVSVRRADLNGLIQQSLYAGPYNSDAMSNPYVLNNGYVDIWLDQPERVNLLIEASGFDPISIYLDVHPPAEEVLRTAYPLRITNTPSEGQILIGLNDTEASFQAPPTITPGVVPAHDHNGLGANSTALGTASSANGLRSTSVGDAAVADSEDSTAFGYQASAGGARGTAVGSGAGTSGTDSTAVGKAAQAAESGTAVGSSAAAFGARAVAVGKQAQASGAGSVAVGPTSLAQGVNSVAVGPGAQATQEGALALGAGAVASHQRSAAFGPGASTTADDQVALGGSGSTVVVLGDLLAQEDAKVAGAAGTLGFFGIAGSTKITIPGPASDPVLHELLTKLAAMGLIGYTV